MAHPRHHPDNHFAQFAVPAALGTTLAICMPLLGLVALLLRGAVVAAAAVAIGTAASVAIWRAVAPTLNPRVAALIHDYAAPAAVGVTLAVCLPLLGIIALVARGALFALLAAAALIALGVGAWRLRVAHRVQHH